MFSNLEVTVKDSKGSWLTGWICKRRTRLGEIWQMLKIKKKITVQKI